MRRRLYEILSVARAGDRPSRAFDALLLLLIVLNVLAILLESVPAIQREHHALLDGFEAFSVLVFSAEYLLRLWSCTTDPAYAHPVRGRLAYAGRPMLVIDLLAVLPFYLTFLHVDLRVLRVLRLLRVMRLLKIARYSNALQVFARVIRAKAPELVSTMFLMLLLLIVAATLMWSVENEAQPDVFSSIPSAMWWGVTTLTTVGYGDMTPVTGLGRLLGSFIAILGIAMFALPAGLLGAAFTEEMRRPPAEGRCPHCGQELP